MIPFRKMNGLGNDFAVIDIRSGGAPLAPERIKALADRRSGIGFDQFITIAAAKDGAAATMRINNADGGEVESCGNAARCVADILLNESGAREVEIASAGGTMRAWRDGKAIAVDMGEPHFDAADIPLRPGAGDPLALVFAEPELAAFGPAACVNVGNPHAVFFVADADAVDLSAVGPQLEHHGVFPERANISFVTLHGTDRAKARVWERGVGATRACGTAACAVAAVGHRTGRTGPDLTVELPGGPLHIALREGRIIMTGPFALDYEGTISAAGFMRNRHASTIP